MRDIFGNEVTVDEARAMLALKKRRDPTPAGYAAQPGTGPSGETCRTCKHLSANEQAKTYYKCGLMSRHWTGGRKSDVLVKAPACRHWAAE
jgi:hypothetical protein